MVILSQSDETIKTR